MHNIIVILLLSTSTCICFETRQSPGKKGKLFIHTLHSASLFPSTVDVVWSATLKNRPALPSWLHLIPSRHKALAYLVGTPLTSSRQLTIHVIAKRSDTFEIRQQYVVITLNEDDRYNKATQQLIDIHVKNYDAETLLSDRSGLIDRLEKSIRDTFRGKNVYPYIYNIVPEIQIPIEKEHLFRYQKIGATVSVGSQQGFNINVHNLVRNLRSHPVFCKRKSHVVLNKHFTPAFDVDWCQTTVRNITASYDSVQEETSKEVKYEVTSFPVESNSKIDKMEAYPVQSFRSVGTVEDNFSFWESVLIFPLIAVFCVILILILSIIFFGRREGQQWRDYKTPKQQLEEYVSVRQSQRHLRELSVQRQLLLMANDRDHSVAPSGIHSFLQPKNRAPTSMSRSTGRFSKSATRLTENNEEAMDLLITNESVPVGKQTVAEAARQCGSSLHLYRNPLESETEEENESDSLEGKEVTGV